MKRYIIIHGHFYQPPREDPRTGVIERQDSAAPYADWNKRVTAECYAACGASRVLDQDGAVLAIINNYRHLSYNFGPTLLNWLEKEAPEAYGRILEADRDSLNRLGHGNAVAQAYNHTILPLDTPRDIRIQVRWGLADFRRRFGRDAEGMWLPECAVGDSVLDVLIEQGLSYVILSPWQARAYTDLEGRQVNLENSPAPSDRPFLIKRPGGGIAAFLYHPDLASAISFGHLLRSKEGLEKALGDILEENEHPLVNVATDGEIYGHHEPFGDMCLSAFVDSQKEDSDLVFTNYAAYLEAHPPEQEAFLRSGDENLGTSWSCSHGLGRWMRDCGCRTGGDESWNQGWRAPLREAFDTLRKEALPIWEEEMNALTGGSAEDALTEYGEVLAGSLPQKEFVRRRLKPAGTRDGGPRQSSPAADLLQSPQAVQMLTLLEGAKFLQFMYTSCGWFFSELSGLEPVQNMRYAARAAELIDPDGTRNLLGRLTGALKKARSNIPPMGTGLDIFENMVRPPLEPAALTAALIFWRGLYNLDGDRLPVWGHWETEKLTRRTVGTEGEKLFLEGEIACRDLSTRRSFNIPYRTTVDQTLFCPEVEVCPEDGTWVTVPIRRLPVQVRLDIQKALLRRSERRLRRILGGQAEDRLRDHMIVETLSLPFGASRWQSLELSLYYGPLEILDQLENITPALWPPLLDRLQNQLHYRSENGIDTGARELETRAGTIVSAIAEQQGSYGTDEVLRNLLRLLTIMREHGMRPLKAYVQNSVYHLLTRNRDAGCPLEQPLAHLARLVNINPIRFNPS